MNEQNHFGQSPLCVAQRNGMQIMSVTLNLHAGFFRSPEKLQIGIECWQDAR